MTMSSQFLHKVRALLFSPDSRWELWARTCYHRIAATRLYFNIQDLLARRSYRRWRTRQMQQPLPPPESFGDPPTVTFVLDVSRTTHEEVIRTLVSIQALQGERWDVILRAAEPSEPNETLSQFLKDSRIRTISGHDDLLKVITGDFVVFCRPGDRFLSSLLIHLYQSLEDVTPPEVIYYDCEVEESGSSELKPFFKPITLSPALMLSVNMLSRGFIRRTALEEMMGDLDPNRVLLALEYEVALRLCEKKASAQHLPSVLVTQTALPQPDTPEMQQVLTAHLTRLGLAQPQAVQTSREVQSVWQAGDPSVAIIIPTKNHHQHLETLLASIDEHTRMPHVQIAIVDNDSDDPATLDFYETLKTQPNLQIIPFRQPFNYSQAINLGVAETESDLVLLMNDDMRVMEPGWLSELARWARRPEIGVVGAKLMRANRTIQHAGIIMGLTGFVGHIYLNAPEDYHGLWGSPDWYRDIMAVTGACQMMRREVFTCAGGYDQGFTLAFGDIDFCLRVRSLGYHNIYTPHARLFHYEGQSRGHRTPAADVRLGYERFGAHLVEGDPFFNPNLTSTRIPKCSKEPSSPEARRAQAAERHSFYTK